MGILYKYRFGFVLAPPYPSFASARLSRSPWERGSVKER